MNALAIQETGALAHSFETMERMALAVAKSGLFGMKSPEQALALMLVAQAEGQHPATITQEYDIIQGRAARKTHSVLARFQAAGGKVQWHTLTHDRAEATFSHPQGGSVTMDWTLDQAKKAGLAGKDNWKNYSRAMLRARVIAEGVRAVYPAALGGMLVTEEAQDLPPPEKRMGQVEFAGAPASAPATSDALLETAEAEAAKGVQAYQKFWAETGPSNRKALATHHESLKAAATAADASRTVDEAPTLTVAKVEELLRAARDVDALNEAAATIEALADEAEKTAMNTLYDELLAGLA